LKLRYVSKENFASIFTAEEKAKSRNQNEAGSKQGFLLHLFFDPEDGGDMFLPYAA
jgi:hypothetical protein